MKPQNYEASYLTDSAFVLKQPIEDSIAPQTVTGQSEATEQSETMQAQNPKQKQEPGMGLQLWRWIGVKDKTLWDYLQLLIVPLLLIIVTDGMNQVQKRAEERRVEQEKIVAEDQSKQDVLNAYIGSMTELIKSGLGREGAVKAQLQPIALSRTILTLKELDATRNSIVLGFLKDSNLVVRDPATQEDLQSTYDQEQADYQACLIENAKAGAKAQATEKSCSVPTLPPSLSLKETDLSKVNFRGVDLNTINLAETNLRGADLTNAVLIDTNLEKADLTDANLTGANLTGANLTGARLPAEHLLINVRYCNTKMPDATFKSDGCSFVPKEGNQYRVVSGNTSAISSGGWTIGADRDPDERDGDEVLIPHGTIVTLTLASSFCDHFRRWIIFCGYSFRL